MAISSSPAGRCGILDSKHWRGRFSTCNLANFLLLLAPKGGRFVSCAAKATAVKVAGAPVSQNLKGYVCLLAIQIVRFRDRSIQTTSSQYCMKNGSLQVKGFASYFCEGASDFPWNRKSRNKPKTRHTKPTDLNS
ncbi:homeobox protein Hox-A3 isoform X2 [Aquila chrysaetos chrysaetos]|uniref:homeobox protein Hox-A3 isoform X2 n=1 Tax=Aquila chrysaetos chrysaetos TaxID=223781 RepID=UPI0011767D76|nr:homeobox protein Hox-A3 isoform X2 [Aquila chrysaetos chrysaetos]